MSLYGFFSNVGPNLANDITNQDENISIHDYLGESIEQSLFMRHVDEEEVIYTTIGDARVCVCLQNWTNFCPYALISTPNVP